MKNGFPFPWAGMLALLLSCSTTALYGQKNSDGVLLGKAELFDAKRTALDYLAEPSVVERFGRISDAIWRFAELGLQEFQSSALLRKNLEAEGFTVETNIAGMPTCFVATWGSGKPVIGILGEFDALPMLSQKPLTPVQDPLVAAAPGHGCGHNTMSPAAIAAAIAVKRSMAQNHITGTIKFFGCPAEETGISRPFMVRAGVFKEVDAVINNHLSSGFATSYGLNRGASNAKISAIFTFKGKTAHAAISPWEGRSALEAVEIMNVAANYLRGHLHPTYRLHYVITDGGEAPNVVPDKASVYYYVRETDDRVEAMFQRVVDCAKGAALATRTEIESIRVLSGIHQMVENKGMAETIQRNIELVGMPQWTEQENAFAKALQKTMGAKPIGHPSKISPLRPPAETGMGGSGDVGDVTLVVPTASVGFPGWVPGAIGHHWSVVASAYGSAAWKGLNAGAKVMAGTALDLMTKPELLAEIKREFAAFSKGHPYKSFLPEDAKPPLDLNKNLMEKFRKAMSEAEERTP